MKCLINRQKNDRIRASQKGGGNTGACLCIRFPEDEATTVVNTLGTLTQQLVKMTHFVSPRPPPVQC